MATVVRTTAKMRHVALLLRQLGRRSKWGVVIDWDFHLNNSWVSAYSPFLVNAIVDRFHPIIITSQRAYRVFAKRVRNIIAFEPGWAAPYLIYDKGRHVVGVMVSDPHNKVDWFDPYFESSNASFALSYYWAPFFYHHPSFPAQKVRHFPWAVPDQYVTPPNEIRMCREHSLHIFGGRQSDAYVDRNWCRQFDFVTDSMMSGCENKVLSDEQFYRANCCHDAVIAAGSLSPAYQLVTPKYFEIPAAGCLLFAQRCRDLSRLGFDDQNCVIFDRSNFRDVARAYLDSPESFISVRARGAALIRERHCLSHRIALLDRTFREWGE